jgi:DNA-binding transcriptional LysR family regulator
MCPQRTRRFAHEREDNMTQHQIRRYLRHGTLPQLSVLEAVLRRGNYTRAAEELNMAQPTVSVQIKKLSEMIGLPLVEQIGRSTCPTPAGHLVNAACQKIFAALGELEEQLNSMRELKGGQLRMAVGTAAKYFAPHLLAEFARKYPDIELSLQIHSREVLLARLAANLDDLTILANPPKGGDYIRQSILPNPLAVFAHIDHPLAQIKNIPFERLASEPFLMREPGSGTRMAVQRLFAERGLTPNVRMELSTNEAIKQAIIAGLGVSVMSRYTLGLDIDQPQLTTLDVQDIPSDGQWVLVYPAGKQLSPAAAAFLKLVRGEAGKLITSHLNTAHGKRVGPD